MNFTFCLVRALFAAALMLLAAPAFAAPPCKPDLTQIVLPDGGRFCGQTQDGKPQGQGRIDWPDGRVYQGGFVNGVMQGKGKFTSDLGWAYQGQFARGMMQGQGTLTVRGSFTYEGRFKQNKPDGQGRLTDNYGSVIEGRFDQNYTAVGAAVVIWPSGERFEGSLRGNAPSGEGVWTRKDKAVVRGTFEYFEVRGSARIEYPDGSIYTGEVGSGQQAWGKGELRRANGEVYTGQFAEDKFDGQGTLTRLNGSVSGYWRKGEFIGSAGDGTLEDTPELARRNVETVLYNQQELLRQQYDAVQSGDSVAPRMYALFVAGDGGQEVFRREIAFVDDLFARRFGTRGHSISLVNSRSSAEHLPLATSRSIAQSLQTLAEKMNRERDFLFVYITSHGSRTHELALGLNGLVLPYLSAQKLADMLKASGIRNQIIVISACYSGGFVPPLQGERTWVITAASADRTSFGCDDERDFTYFGDALFKQALPTALTLSVAFQQADQLVGEWETRDAKAQADAAPEAQSGDEDQARENQHSKPLSVVSPEFQGEVDAWFQAHPPAE
ncbi:MAG: hypothetical protein LBV44_06385 [Methylobacillus sp.]|jgi:hypothetical protein|nr:hypothetical protein [Methylobacillus sp.]